MATAEGEAFFPDRMRSQEIDISVIIVTFNSRTTIARCVQTLACSVFPLRVELILIDNASTDGTTSVLKKLIRGLCSEFAKVTVLYNKKNLGYTRAVNQGLARSRGRLVLLLNPDIEFPAPILTTLTAQFERLGIVAVAPQLRYPNGAIQPSCRRFPIKRDILFEVLGLTRIFCRSAFFNRWRMPDFAHDHSRAVEQPQGAFLLIKRSILQSIGQLDERFPMFFSDVDLCRRLYQHGIIWFCAEVFAVHLRGASVKQVRERMIVSSHRSFADYFAKYDQTKLQIAVTRLIRFVLLCALPLRLTALKLGRG